MALGNGLSVANDRDGGRLASRRLYRTGDGTNLSWLTYGYDANDNVTAIDDRLDDSRSIFYGYDANDRLNLTVLTASSVTPGTDTFAYTAGTNRLASLTTPAGTRTFGYDGRGNLSSEGRPGSAGVVTSYDGYARLTGYARDDTGALGFVYNGRDDRVAMTSVAGARTFVYAPDGRVLGEYGASAADVRAEFAVSSPATCRRGPAQSACVEDPLG